MKDYLLSHRKIVSVGLIIVGVLLVAIPSIISDVSLVQESSSKLEVGYYLSQIVSAVFVIAGVVIAGWQYYLTSRTEIVQINTNQVQRAIDLSEYYKDNILKKYSPIRYVYEESGIKDLIKAIDKSKMINFDLTEAKRIITEDNIEKFKIIQGTQKFCEAVIEADKIYNIGLNPNIFNPCKIPDEKGTEHEVCKVDTYTLTICFMRDNVTCVLNNLEFFAMHFSHGTADESVVFQSLHQTYIEIVQLLYYNIARLNVPMQTKYYTNVIELYNKWYNRMTEQVEAMAVSSRNSTKKGTIIQKQKD